MENDTDDIYELTKEFREFEIRHGFFPVLYSRFHLYPDGATRDLINNTLHEPPTDAKERWFLVWYYQNTRFGIAQREMTEFLQRVRDTACENVDSEELRWTAYRLEREVAIRRWELRHNTAKKAAVRDVLETKEYLAERYPELSNPLPLPVESRPRYGDPEKDNPLLVEEERLAAQS